MAVSDVTTPHITSPLEISRTGKHSTIAIIILNGLLLKNHSGDRFYEHFEIGRFTKRRFLFGKR